MKSGYALEKISYGKEAPGWVGGVYYPREPQIEAMEGFGEEDEVWRLHSRVWQEIEETGYGIYCYEETVRLVSELPGSNYRVTLLLVNPEEETYRCHIRVNGIVKKTGVEVAPGGEKKVSFTACMTDGKFVLTLAAGRLEDIHSEVLEGYVYLKDVEIQQEKCGEKRKSPHIFLVSDSTVQSYEKFYYPQTGWGQVLCSFFQGAGECRAYAAENCDYSQGRTYEMPELVIENRSIGGRSARSFYEEGKLDQVLEVICPGDYMLIQFAHNDATAIRPNRYIAPEDFPGFLQIYLDACERRGVQAVLVTPVTMRVLREDGSNEICFAEYREQMMRLAEEKNIPLLDLGGRSTDYLNRIGPEESKNLYMWLEEGEYPDGAYAGGVFDKCHLQEYGARIYANMVAEMIQEYSQDNRLDALKKLAAPVLAEEIPKPCRKKPIQGKQDIRQEDEINGFAVQEISVENGRGSFLLNWSPLEKASAYRIYAKKAEDSAYRLVKTVSREEKEKAALLPFAAEAGALWLYYVAAVFEDGREGRGSRIKEVDLRLSE